VSEEIVALQVLLKEKDAKLEILEKEVSFLLGQHEKIKFHN